MRIKKYLSLSLSLSLYQKLYTSNIYINYNHLRACALHTSCIAVTIM